MNIFIFTGFISFANNNHKKILKAKKNLNMLLKLSITFPSNDRLLVFLEIHLNFLTQLFQNFFQKLLKEIFSNFFHEFLLIFLHEFQRAFFQKKIFKNTLSNFSFHFQFLRRYSQEFFQHPQNSLQTSQRALPHFFFQKFTLAHCCLQKFL